MSLCLTRSVLSEGGCLLGAKFRAMHRKDIVCVTEQTSKTRGYFYFRNWVSGFTDVSFSFPNFIVATEASDAQRDSYAKRKQCQ